MKCLSILICVILIFSVLTGKSDCSIQKPNFLIEYMFVGQLNYLRRSSLSNSALSNLIPTKYARLHILRHTHIDTRGIAVLTGHVKAMEEQCQHQCSLMDKKATSMFRNRIEKGRQGTNSSS